MEAVRTSAHRSLDDVAVRLGEWLDVELGIGDVEAISTPAGAGFSNETWFVTAGGEELVVQAAPLGTALFRDYDIVAMARLQEALALGSSVPVPPILGAETDDEVLGGPFFVMQRVRGRVPTDAPPYHRDGWFAELTADEREQAWWSGIDAVTELGRIKADDPAFAFLTSAPWGMAVGADAACTRVEQWRSFSTWAFAEVPGEIDAALAALADRTPAPVPLAVHWGDAKLSNCVIDGDVAALLDWELCGLSDPTEDLAHWLVVDWACQQRAGRRLDGIPTAAATVERAGVDPDRALWWFQLGLTRLAIIVQRLLEQMRALGGLPADADVSAMNSVTRSLATVLDWRSL